MRAAPPPSHALRAHTAPPPTPHPTPLRAGTLAFVIALPAVAPTHQSANWVFTHFNKPDVGISNNAYIFFIGLLMSQFTLTG